LKILQLTVRKSC